MKQQVNINGEWLDLLGVHEHGEWRVYVFAHIDGNPDVTYRRIEVAPLPTRPAPVVDDELHTPTPHEPVAGVKLFDVLEAADIEDPEAGGAEVFVDGVHAGYVIGSSVMCGGCHSAKFETPLHANRFPSADFRAFRDRIRAERAATQPAGDGWVVDKVCGLWFVERYVAGDSVPFYVDKEGVSRRGADAPGTDFPTRADAVAALAKWRAAQQPPKANDGQKLGTLIEALRLRADSTEEDPENPESVQSLAGIVSSLAFCVGHIESDVAAIVAKMAPPPPDLAERVGVVVGELEKYAEYMCRRPCEPDVVNAMNALVTGFELVREMAAKGASK